MKTKFYMYNTIADVALTKIIRETNYFQDFLQCPKLVTVLRSSTASGMSLASSSSGGNFQPHLLSKECTKLKGRILVSRKG